MVMVGAYVRSRICTQIKAVIFVVLYLLAVQLLLFKVPIRDVLGISLGMVATVVGLALFLEGLFLGIMPLGVQCGLRLPVKVGPVVIAIFAIILGMTATLAEPAIGILRSLGQTLTPWEAPLLYLLLNRRATWLVLAIASGVGLAVIIGVFRFLFGWSFKPFVFSIFPILLAVTIIGETDPGLASIVGLAWDTGGVTTGPVTVPLVIALGIGISRISGARHSAISGLGVVSLASALPVAAVLLLAAMIAPMVPAPSSAADFFADRPEQRRLALQVSGDTVALRGLAEQALASGQLDPADFRLAFPELSLANDHAEPAGPGQDADLAAAATDDADPAVAARDANLVAAIQEAVPTATIPVEARPAIAPQTSAPPSAPPSAPHAVWQYLLAALKAVIPLVMVLLVVLLVVLRERIRDADQIVLGLVFTVIGMFVFGLGMDRGLAALGTQAGAAFPRAYLETERHDRAVTLRGIDQDSLLVVLSPDGPKQYVWIQGPTGPQAVPFDASRWDPQTGQYRYIPVESAVFASWGRHAGMVAVLVFVLILGLGATLAEPSLSALGSTVEDLTTGTYRKTTLIRTVGIGVGIGMAVGFSRILFDLPLSWILGPPYAAALVLTAFSPDEFSAIAWDCGGVTTGPVTVPLVIATALGLGADAAVSFGVIASASIFPILAVLVSGLISEAGARRSVVLEAVA
jgi:hypothetical protein